MFLSVSIITALALVASIITALALDAAPTTPLHPSWLHV
tara:strand:- start:274 stop:390 length:117 start_codon:yes stop_codon:yes gene_type:complete